MAADKFKWKHLPKLLKETYQEWNNSDPWRQSAVVAYYAVFSLPALLIIVVTIAGAVFGEDAVQGRVSEEVGSMIGGDAAEQVETMITNAYQHPNSIWATIAGVATLIFGATGVFYQLQQSLNNIWDVEADQNAGIKKLALDRMYSFGIILVIGFLLLISLTLTAALTALSDFISTYVPDYLLYVFYIAQFLVSFGVVTLLFAMIYKILPDVEIEWRTVWVGAVVTAFLFMLGKFGLGIYFGKSDPASAYGAAGSLILILLWTSYSCLILFFGAEFTQVYARKYGHPITPSNHAKKTREFDQNHAIGSKKAPRQKAETPAVQDRDAVGKNGAEVIRVQRVAKRSDQNNPQSH